MSISRSFYNSLLMLNDGKIFLGKSIGKVGESMGEVCFTTSMVGYQHTITDPSFAEQIIAFTFPHIGNIGINNQDNERKRILAKGIIIRESSPDSHPSSISNLDSWLKVNNIVGISGIDTRALTHHLRKYGSQNCIIASFTDYSKINYHDLKTRLSTYPSLEGVELAMKASETDDYIVKKVDNCKYNIVIIDFGMKSGIATCLTNLVCSVTTVSAQSNFASKVLSLNPDGIVLSNGPGDPHETSLYASKEINTLIESGIPIFGICLGHQLLALAVGGKTIKMKHGHRGSNHPIYNKEDKIIEITSQNHGFMVDPECLPDNVVVTHTSLFDNSIAGIKLNNYPVFSVQYHPEGSPGPHDSYSLFSDFLKLIDERNKF